MGISAKPYAYYEMASGADSAGNGPTLTGGSYAAGGVIGNGLAEASVPSSATLMGIDLTAGNFSLGTFVNITATTISDEDGGVFTLYIDDADFSATLVLSVPGADGEGVLEFAGLIYNFTLTAGQHHFAGVREGTSARIYIDGVLVQSGAFTPTAGGGAGPVIQNGNISGKLDNAFFHDDAYSAADLLYLYQGGASIAYASMVENTVPAALTLRLTSFDAKTMSVDWDAPADGGADLVRYGVYRSVNGASFTLFDNIPATATTYAYSTGERSVTHALKVAAVNSAGTATLSNSQGVL